MTKKERVVRAFRHRESDIIPYHLEYTIPAHARMAAYPGGDEILSVTGHLGYTQYGGWSEERADKPGHFTDAFGVTWDRTVDKDIGVIDAPSINQPDSSLWREPYLDEDRLRREYETLLANESDRFVFGGIGFSMFERLWSLCGMENALIFMLDRPDFVHDLLDRICEYNLKIIAVASEYPLDGFYFGDDWGQQRGLIMGPQLWRTFIKPRMERMYAAAKKGGRYIIQHSCGDIREIFPDLIEIGLDCYQTFQPEIYDIEAIKGTYGNDLSFWGGISTQQLLPMGTPDAVKRECVRIMKIMGRGGGYIAAPTHALPGDIPPENIEAMLDVFINQDQYL